MSEEWKNYVKDPRTVCKYGSKCYQKNPDHRKQFKHPPKLSREQDNSRDSKRFKKNASPPKNPQSDANQDEESVKETDSKTRNSPKTDLTENKNSKQINSDNISHLSTNESSPSIRRAIEYHPAPEDIQDFIKKEFHLKAPDDFLEFWKFLQSMGGMKALSKVNLEAVGLYDVVCGRLPVTDHLELYHIHWRYYYDPPEFHTVLRCVGKSESHMGYYWDRPEHEPAFVAGADSSKGCAITPLGPNIFAAVYSYLESTKKKSPFVSMHCQKLMDQIKSWVADKDISLEATSPQMKSRLRHVVARTFHGAGIVVPVEKKTELGYRKLMEKDSKIKEMIEAIREAKSDTEKDKALSALQPTITMANIATDECDFGTGLELGLDLFSSGLPELDGTTLQLLCTAYAMLKREPFIEIIKAHLAHRRKGNNLSMEEILQT